MGNLGRFTLITGHPVLPPGRCSGCGTTGDKNYVDMNLQIQFFGRVIFCVDCIRNAAMEHCDVVPRHNLETLQSDSVIKTNTLREALNKIKELEDAVDHFESLRTYFAPVGDSSVAPSLEPQAAIEEPSPVGKALGSSKRSEQGSPEQDYESGSADVRSSNSADELLNLI